MSSILPTPFAPPVWRSGLRHWAPIVLALAALGAAFFDMLHFTVANWAIVEEYSYGYFIVPIVAFLIWQKADALRELQLQGRWSGLALIALALAMLAVGQASAVRLLGQYGFVVAVYGLVVCAIGWRGTRVIAVPLAFLFFMIPLPQFLLRELSHALQLVSSQWGVALIRLFDISVFLEGNVIDLGSMQLQVVEACSGLRYLFPLVVLGMLAAWFFQAPWWQRALLVVSTVPFTILINSLRIGLIGVTVEHWGPQMAEGLLHDFEGWFMFLICIALLIGEMALLARLSGRSLGSAFALDAPAPADPARAVVLRAAPAAAWGAVALLAAAGAAQYAWPEREQQPPPRTSFRDFPLDLPGGWSGRTDPLEPQVLAILALDDYFNANFARAGEPPVNFYSAYYADQSGGESTHSPRTCMPGGGWVITDLREQVVQPLPAGTPVRLNRVLIEHGGNRQLVYYWFRQRGHDMTNEFAVKWAILRDGIVLNRSDGALLRLVTPLARDETPAAAEQRLAHMLGAVQPLLPRHIPD